MIRRVGLVAVDRESPELANFSGALTWDENPIWCRFSSMQILCQCCPAQLVSLVYFHELIVAASQAVHAILKVCIRIHRQ